MAGKFPRGSRAFRHPRGPAANGALDESMEEPIVQPLIGTAQELSYQVAQRVGVQAGERRVDVIGRDRELPRSSPCHHGVPNRGPRIRATKPATEASDATRPRICCRVSALRSTRSAAFMVI